MDYEKAYKEAVKKLRYKITDNNGNIDYNEIVNVDELQDIFHELAESENEIIRKDLIEWIEDFPDSVWRGHLKKDIIAWLEKQDKQELPQVYETVDGETITYSESEGYKVVEPKFKIGDWITDGRVTRQITDIDSDYYWYSENHPLGHIIGVDKTFHLWSIEDAIDGDVLLSKHNQPFIYNGIFDEENVGAYCGIDKSGDYFLKSIFSCEWSYKEGVKPATKEQCALLFSKMHEAGYEWDSKNKELVKIENTNEEEDLEKEEERKELISLFKNKIISSKENSSDVEFYKKALLWLEKQGETSQVLLNTGKDKKDEKIGLLKYSKKQWRNTMKPKDIKSLIEEIQEAAAHYCYDHEDQDFEITLSIRAEDGWVKVEEQQ